MIDEGQLDEPVIPEENVLEEKLPETNPTEVPTEVPVEAVAELVVAERKPFKITVEHEPQVCYALAYNKVPTIRTIAIENVEGGVSGQLTVTAMIKWSVSDEAPMRPFEVVVDAPAMGDTIIVNGQDFRLDDTVIVDLTETAAARLEVTVKDALGNTQTESSDIEIYARNQWLSTASLRQLTAAFVQPNHPSVNEVLAKAGAILDTQGRDRSFEGYQRGPVRAREIGEAIFLALQSMIDQYINPPAGYEDVGQKLRPLDEVLAQRQGTCIDLACAYASCLEQAGLHPVVFLVHGHAFTGFFLNDSDLAGGAVVDDFATCVTMLESGMVVAAETTLLPTSGTFEEATEAIKNHLKDRDSGCDSCERLLAAGAPVGAHPHLMAMVNIAQCHRDGILPLPVRIERDGVVMLVIDNGPTQAPIIERRDAKTRKLLPDTVPARVQQWKNALLDLTFRNSLLHYRPAKTGVELLVPAGQIGQIEDSVSAGNPILITPSDVVNQALAAGGFRFARDLNPPELLQHWVGNSALYSGIEEKGFVAKFRNLVSKAKVEEQETGSNNLYMTFGSLKWRDPRAKVGDVQSPIFMVPIRIQMKRGQTLAQIVIDDGAFTTINYCLIEALRAKMQMNLQWFSDDMADAFGLDINAGLQAMRQEILEKGLTRDGFEVVEDASIGFLRFSKIRLWKDLDEHWEAFSANPIVSHLVDGGRGRFTDPADPEGNSVDPPKDTELLNPQPADGAQSIAIKRALADHSFVLEGPPGTGKSQTITNLLANALASGKKVLFVAEKQAALSVVHERLQEAGLDPFCLELHNKGSRPEDIKRQLREALDFSPDADMGRWDRHQREFDVSSRVLDSYRDKVHSKNAAGTSYYDAYVRLLRLGAEPVADHARQLVNVDLESIARYELALDEMESVTQPAQPRPGHPWSLATAQEFAALDRAALAAAINALGQIPDMTASSDQWLLLASAAESMVELIGIESVLALAVDGLAPSIDQWREISRPGWADSLVAGLDSISATTASVGDLTSSIGLQAFTEDFQPIETAVIAAAGSFVLGRKGRLQSALGRLAAVDPFANASAEQLPAMMRRLVEASSSVRAAVAALVSSPGGIVPAGWFPTGVDDLAAMKTKVLATAEAGSFLAGGTPAADRAMGIATGLALPNRSALDSIRSLTGCFTELQRVLVCTDESIALWEDGRGIVPAVAASLETWKSDVENGTYRGIQRWLALINAVSGLADVSIADFRRQLLRGEISGHDARNAFDRALMSATLVEVGEERDLDVFEYSVHDRQVRTFTAGLDDRQELLRTVIPKMLFDSRGFNGSATTGSVGELRRELGSNKRGARSVRGLLSKYPELVQSLTPCFLMSPDSVANFLVPGKVHFDLVVFDEASQIPVSSAVGALGRATSAVIVGDSRQMPPSTFGAVAGSGEQDEFDSPLAELEQAVVADAESILEECVESGLDQEWLAWHYRSRDEVLIKFSNDHYYDGRLSSFPSPFHSVPDCGIELRRVDGQFDHGGKRTNAVEADAIVAEVARRANDPALRGASIGIVTLNTEQRNLVLERLAALGDPNVMSLLESEDDAENLFVLNLESVQGRERDVIILGTSFSKRANGDRMPLNFGPLTNKGGERRLNVAVTRARKQVIVVSSFDPQELQAANALGMVHLREYLELARLVTQGTRPVTVREADLGEDLHRQEIVTALKARGLEVETGIGLSSFKVDLAVTLPGFEDRWLVGVLLDGPSWSERTLASDRDALPLTVLQKMMGWSKIARIWLPAWRKSADEIVEEIYRMAIEVSLVPVAEPVVEPIPEPTPPLAVDPVIATSVEPVDGSGPTPLAAASSAAAPTETVTTTPALGVLSRSGERPFVEFPNRTDVGTRAELESGSPQVRQYLSGLVESHGPMLKSEAIRQTAKAFGLARVGDARYAQFSDLVPAHQVIVTEFGEFVFPVDCIIAGEVTDETFDWFRLSTAAQRKIDEISPHEFTALAVCIATESFSISEDDLVASMLTEFGYARKVGDTVEHTRRLVRWAVASGRLVSDGEQIKVADPGR